MASYQARGRDPLFDADTALTLEKRGRELIGIVLVVIGLMASAMIASYTPDDPSWIAATDAPVQNWMGRLGAYIAAPLFMIVGLGSWALALVFLTWGVRMVLHREEGRMFWCLIMSPAWVLMCSVYASGLPHSATWSHDFGLGGLFGDMMMGSLLNLLPMSLAAGLKLMQLILGVGILAMGAFVLGFTRPELARLGRFLVVGVVMSYAQLVRVLGLGASGAARAAQRAQAAQAQRREQRQAEAAAFAAEQDAYAHAEPPVTAPSAAMPAAPRVRRTETVYDPDLLEDDAQPEFALDVPAPAPEPEKTGFLSRMPSLIRRADPDPMPEPDLVEELVDHDMDAPGEDRIKAKIARAVNSRKKTGPTVSFTQPDPSKPLTKGRGHGPRPMIFNPAVRPGGSIPAEPPLTAAARELPPEPPLTASARMPEAAMPEVAMPAPPAMPPRAPVDENAYAGLSDFDDYGDEGAEFIELDSFDEPEQPNITYKEPSYLQPEPEPEYDAGYDASYDDDVQTYQADPAPVPIQRGGVVPMPEPKKVVQKPVRKPILPSKRAQAEAQPSLQFDDHKADYELPPLNLLMSPDQIERHHLSDEALEENARMLESVLDDYGVKGEIVSVRPGPVVTMYELEPAPGLKASRVIGLADDIARSMSALSARVSTVPGRSVIGIELPNDKREMVCFREILAGREFGDGNHKLPLALGKDIGGDPVVANLAKMPHLLIAGTTGSGKSVAINTMILSLLYKLTPDDLRLVMIDPKMLELSVYDGIPHLLSPVVTDPKKAVVALKWVVGEMEDRYRKMSKMGVRNIDGYNGRVADALSKGEMFERTVQTGFDDETGEPIFETEQIEPKKMPYIVVIVDEMADLMMVAGKEIEACIQRLAQMARASGIHLIMATQRPSVDVITGTIKANFPTRISFQVTSKIDSRTILGEMGAEQLLGMGDMLYMAGGAKITRCHGPFCSDEEVEEIVNHLKAFGPPEYVSGVVQGPDEDKADNIDAVLGLNTGGNTTGEDALYDQAVAIVIKDRKCSTSYIQRKLGIGYNKAARLVEQMEDEQIVSPANHVGKREILVPEAQ
ncbi:DNA translocase FtsK [Tropicibacter naphthalenivorans]|uniref:DNA translocase FtsK n=1 Tax=Tropicibacter naphthalenivorans TaxID=441103 RepID=A0A0P1G9V0_9RHOB|nr:DNA translocase FtsK [Tropicibacter naphthalenivorans]CUH78309.1 DNA translocase FtsK [Tropicibacter naphthalenivorans]SMC79210.1 DNA translocase FtsK [Tropicibacter naphthalenivorans]